MKKNAKRGVNYFWVPNHIQDANGEVSPRAFFKCFAFASEEMLKHKEEIRINLPEVYLHGFGLKRKGGIKRPKKNFEKYLDGRRIFIR